MNTSEAGYSITKKVFERSEIAQIREALVAADLARTKAGARHVLSLPGVKRLASNPALVALAASFIGDRPITLFGARDGDCSASSSR